MMRAHTAILRLLNGIALFSLCIVCRPAPAAPADYLHAVGTRLVNGAGHTVTLTGGNTWGRLLDTFNQQPSTFSGDDTPGRQSGDRQK